jgi:hypothetical protein
MQQFGDALDANRPARHQRPAVRPADEDRPGAERKRFQHVGAASNAAVDEHRDSP